MVPAYISEIVLEELPVIAIRVESGASILADEELGIALTEEGIKVAISQLRSDKALAKQPWMSSVLMRNSKRLCFVGQIERMQNERLPKKLLVCTSEHGKRSAGGQWRWSDGVTRDLTRCPWIRPVL